MKTDMNFNPYPANNQQKTSTLINAGSINDLNKINSSSNAASASEQTPCSGGATNTTTTTNVVTHKIGPIYHVGYLGSAILTKGKTGLGCLQQPLRELYTIFRQHGSRLMQERRLSVSPDGITMFFNELNVEKFLHNDLSTVYDVQLLKFATQKRKDKKTYCAFLPPGGELEASYDNLFAPLDKQHLKYMTDSLPHPPLVVLIMRRTIGIQALECHVFIGRTAQEGKTIANCINDACSRYKFDQVQQTKIFQYQPYNSSAGSPVNNADLPKYSCVTSAPFAPQSPGPKILKTPFRNFRQEEVSHTHGMNQQPVNTVIVSHEQQQPQQQQQQPRPATPGTPKPSQGSKFHLFKSQSKSKDQENAIYNAYAENNPNRQPAGPGQPYSVQQTAVSSKSIKNNSPATKSSSSIFSKFKSNFSNESKKSKDGSAKKSEKKQPIPVKNGKELKSQLKNGGNNQPRPNGAPNGARENLVFRSLSASNLSSCPERQIPIAIEFSQRQCRPRTTSHFEELLRNRPASAMSSPIARYEPGNCYQRSYSQSCLAQPSMISIASSDDGARSRSGSQHQTKQSSKKLSLGKRILQSARSSLKSRSSVNQQDSKHSSPVKTHQTKKKLASNSCVSFGSKSFKDRDVDFQNVGDIDFRKSKASLLEENYIIDGPIQKQTIILNSRPSSSLALMIDNNRARLVQTPTSIVVNSISNKPTCVTTQIPILAPLGIPMPTAILTPKSKHVECVYGPSRGDRSYRLKNRSPLPLPLQTSEPLLQPPCLPLPAVPLQQQQTPLTPSSKCKYPPHHISTTSLYFQKPAQQSPCSQVSSYASTCCNSNKYEPYRPVSAAPIIKTTTTTVSKAKTPVHVENCGGSKKLSRHNSNSTIGRIDFYDTDGENEYHYTDDDDCGSQNQHASRYVRRQASVKKTDDPTMFSNHLVWNKAIRSAESVDGRRRSPSLVTTTKSPAINYIKSPCAFHKNCKANSQLAAHSVSSMSNSPYSNIPAKPISRNCSVQYAAPDNEYEIKIHTSKSPAPNSPFLYVKRQPQQVTYHKTYHYAPTSSPPPLPSHPPPTKTTMVTTTTSPMITSTSSRFLPSGHSNKLYLSRHDSAYNTNSSNEDNELDRLSKQNSVRSVHSSRSRYANPNEIRSRSPSYVFSTTTTTRPLNSDCKSYVAEYSSVPCDSRQTFSSANCDSAKRAVDAHKIIGGVKVFPSLPHEHKQAAALRRSRIDGATSVASTNSTVLSNDANSNRLKNVTLTSEDELSRINNSDNFNYNYKSQEVKTSEYYYKNDNNLSFSDGSDNDHEVIDLTKKTQIEYNLNCQTVYPNTTTTTTTTTTTNNNCNSNNNSSSNIVTSASASNCNSGQRQPYASIVVSSTAPSKPSPCNKGSNQVSKFSFDCNNTASNSSSKNHYVLSKPSTPVAEYVTTTTRTSNGSPQMIQEKNQKTNFIYYFDNNEHFGGY